MKLNYLFTLLICAGLSGAALAEEKRAGQDKMAVEKMSEQGKMEHGAASHAEAMPGITEASGVGVINSVDADKGTVNLTHEPMPELGWPTMTMDLPVTKRVELGGVKAGDKVDFKLKFGRDKTYRITEMEASK